MRININVRVRIDNEPGDSSMGYMGGSMTFSEDAQINGAGFETTSEVFTKCHELLTVLKQKNSPEGRKKG